MPYLYPFPEAGDGEVHPRVDRRVVLAAPAADLISWRTSSTVPTLGEIVFTPGDFFVAFPVSSGPDPVTHFKVIGQGATVGDGTWIAIDSPDSICYIETSPCTYTATGYEVVTGYISTDGASAAGSGTGLLFISDASAVCAP